MLEVYESLVSYLSASSEWKAIQKKSHRSSGDLKFQDVTIEIQISQFSFDQFPNVLLSRINK